MEQQPYGIEVWDTRVMATDGITLIGSRYYWRLYYTSNAQQAATSGSYSAKYERDKYAEQFAAFSAITIRDRYPADSTEL